MIDEKRLLEEIEDHKVEFELFGIASNFVCTEIVKDIIRSLKKENRWIPCSKKMPPQPKKNPIFENKPLDVYLVCVSEEDYPFRAFWNGKFFTDGWRKQDVLAWMPLPEPYKGE